MSPGMRSLEHERHLRRVIRRHCHWVRRAPEGAPIVGECVKLVRRYRILVKDDHRFRNQKSTEAD